MTASAHSHISLRAVPTGSSHRGQNHTAFAFTFPLRSEPSLDVLYTSPFPQQGTCRQPGPHQFQKCRTVTLLKAVHPGELPRLAQTSPSLLWHSVDM